MILRALADVIGELEEWIEWTGGDSVARKLLTKALRSGVVQFAVRYTLQCGSFGKLALDSITHTCKREGN